MLSLFRFITRLQGVKVCTLHEVTEAGCYPYRCSHCGECFICTHLLVGYRWWLCPNGALTRTLFSAGVPTLKALNKRMMGL